MTLTLTEVHEAVIDNAHDDQGHEYASQLTVHNPETDLYEIATFHRRRPVCLTITIDPNTLGMRPRYPTTTKVTNGRCPTSSP